MRLMQVSDLRQNSPNSVKTIKIAINQQEEQINMKSNKKISTKKKTKKIIMRDKLKIRIIRNQKNLKKLVKMLKD